MTETTNWRYWEQRALAAENRLACIEVAAVRLTASVKRRTAQMKAALSVPTPGPHTITSAGETDMAATIPPTGVPEVDALVTAIAAEDAEIADIIAYVQGVPAQITTAVNAALAASNATAASVAAAATQAAADVASQTAAMAAAIPAPAPTPPSPVTP